MVNNKLIVIVGPTASGKSDLAVFLARKFNGEIISADSRQVYKYMDIGTGKITKKETKGIPHYMLDVAHPSRQFTVAQFKKRGKKIIADIQKRNKLPILVGGTGFYIDSVVYNIDFPKVKANPLLRSMLRNKTTEELFEMLKRKDPRRAKTIERKNKRRLIRALEIIDATGKPVPSIGLPGNPMLESSYDLLIIGIKIEKERLHKRIEKQLDARLRQGMIAEVKKLREKIGVSWKRLENFGLEYRWIARYLQKKITKEKMHEELVCDIKRYSKRQMTWFKRDKGIHWIALENKKQLQEEAEKLLKTHKSAQEPSD